MIGTSRARAREAAPVEPDTGGWRPFDGSVSIVHAAAACLKARPSDDGWLVDGWAPLDDASLVNLATLRISAYAA